ncbi:UbiA family prenyltransferase [Streptomyces sp. NEAU-YJ-81]|nr:UbiA family prenyltransferase [Streptomyces sp. NEAU-YJ-81]
MTRAAAERGNWGNWGDWAELLRVSALFTVPGDALAGAAAARCGPNRGTALAVCASLCLYEAGMALNDWADRDIDAVERPGRPLPSGRIAPGAALTAATGLTAAGLLCAAAAGRPALATAAALAGTVWAYDLGLKNTPAGPPAMAAARALDLLLGASASAPAALRSALPPAALLGAHTLAVTTVSRREAVGGSSAAPLGALVAGTAIAWAATRRPTRPATVTGRTPGRGLETGSPAVATPAEAATAPNRRGASDAAMAARATTGRDSPPGGRRGPRRAPAAVEAIYRGTASRRRGAPGGDQITGGAVAAVARELSRAGLHASSDQGNRPRGRRILRRAVAQMSRIPAAGAALGGVSASGRGPAVGGAGGRGLAGMRSRSAAVRQAAATVRAAAPPRATVPVLAVRAAAAPAVVQGARAAATQGLAHRRGKGGGARSGGPLRRLVAAATAATGRGGPPGSARAGAARTRNIGTIASRGAAAERTRPVSRIAAVARVGLAGGRAGAALPRSIVVPAAAATVGAATATGRTRPTSRFAAVAGVVLAGGYVATVARPLAHAALNPSPYFLQRAVGSGIRAMIPLQAVLASRAGAHRTAAGLLALMPVARRLSRKVSAT